MHNEPGGERAGQPIFNAPTVVVGLVAAMAIVHAGRELLLSENDADWWTIALAFVPGRYGDSGGELPGAPYAAVTSVVTHMLVHGNFAHIAINSAWLLAVGTPVARRMPAGAFLAFFGLCGVAGAALFWVFNIGLMAPMVGASGAISGLMAAVFRLMYGADGSAGWHLLREHPEAAPCLSLRATLASRPALTAIGVWVAVNFVFAFGLGGLAAPGGVAWEAHLGGFFAGLLAFGLFDRGPRTVD